jgi:hypothetical protein
VAAAVACQKALTLSSGGAGSGFYGCGYYSVPMAGQGCHWLRLGALGWQRLEQQQRNCQAEPCASGQKLTMRPFKLLLPQPLV